MTGRKSGLRAALGLLLVCAAAPMAAQTSGTLDLRVGKLEKEMRAVQRSVFPQGVPVEPEITTTVPSAASGTPATAPVADLTARINSLETQLSALTGASEQNGFRIRQLEDALAKVQARLNALDGTAATTSTPAATTPTLAAPVPTPSTSGALTDPVPTATPKPEAEAAPTPRTAITPPAAAKPVATKPVPAKVDPARKALVAAVEVPDTGDAIEDEYTYGFRLYSAKLYPEAQVKLKDFVAKHPAHRRASYAQNLLGRAYFDEGKPALASVAFYDNYQKMPTGERAAESLYWLGQSLTKLKKLADACKVYDELSEVFGTKLSSDLKARTAKGRSDAQCAA